MLLLNLMYNIISTAQKDCITNYTNEKFLSITTSCLHCSDNFNHATCFEYYQEAFESKDKPYFQEFYGNELELLVRTDSMKSVFEDN